MAEDRDGAVASRLDLLASGFDRYVAAYDVWASTGLALTTHRRTVALRREAGSAAAAVTDPRFVESLRSTLVAWGVGRRGSHLVSPSEFGAALQAAVPAVTELEELTIDTVDEPASVSDRLWRLIDTLGVTTNHCKLVAGTKTLHHLLPDLVVPMDRKWTGSFFDLSVTRWQNQTAQQRTLAQVFSGYAALARRTDIQRLATDMGWRTSRTKVLDNAMSAFCVAARDDQSIAGADADNQVSIEVTEYPPAKNEAKSLFASGHPHAPRVRALLSAAQDAIQQQAFEPIATGPVAMEVVLHAPSGPSTADLTNVLGGIADVLQIKHGGYGTEHLGGLADVWLYDNDRQIADITGRAIPSDDVRYRVTVRALDTR